MGKGYFDDMSGFAMTQGLSAKDEAHIREQGMRDGMRLLDSVAGPAVERAIAEAIAARDREWVEALVEEYRAYDWSNTVAKTAIDNIAERLNQGEPFAARLRARAEGKSNG